MPHTPIARRFPVVAAGAALLALAPAARAQVLSGTVVSRAAGGPVAGAVVLLVDSSGAEARRALSDERGAFRIIAPAPGRYRVRTRRIGYQPGETAEMRLVGDTTIRLAVSDLPVALPAVSTVERSRCRIRPDSGLATYVLWEEARTALMSAAITLESARLRFDALHHSREYDTRSGALRVLAIEERRSSGARPWASLDPEDLRRSGYVREERADRGMLFVAPDLDVLLSPYFADAHCLRLSAARPPAPGLIGLDFAPAARARHSEIGGTVWLDGATRALREVVYYYTDLPFEPGDSTAGGRVEFLRLPSGEWIIPRWRIQTPVPTRLARRDAGIDPRTTAPPRRREASALLRIAGGDVRAVAREGAPDDDAPLWSRPLAELRLRALAPGGRPVPGVFASLVGGSLSAVSDDSGLVRFPRLVDGEYLVEAVNPLAEMLWLPPDTVRVAVRDGSLAEGRLAVPGEEQAARAACGAKLQDQGLGVIVGAVFGGEEPVAGAIVEVDWRGAAGARGRDAERGRTAARGDGRFRFCGVPRGVDVRVRVRRADGSPAGAFEQTVRVERPAWVASVAVRL